MGSLTGLRALIPARLSRKQKTGEEGIGLDTQDEKSRAFCEAEGMTVVEVTKDTISGSKAPMDRKNFGPWVTDPEKIAQYDCIVAYKSDRLSRGIDVDWSRIETWAADNGKKLIIVAPSDGGIQYPSRDDSDYWQWSAMKRQAGNELKDIKERTSRARAAIKAQGGFLGRAPWGYVISGEKYSKTITPTEEGKRLVPQIFSKVIAGDSLEAVAKWLKTETGKGWWARSVGGIVRNTVYMGYQTDESGKVIFKSESLVDAMAFKRAGESLDSRPKRGAIIEDNRALCSSILYCSECAGESPMYRVQSQNTRKDGTKTNNPYYRCSGKGTHRRGCGNMIQASVMDEFVSDSMANLKRKIMRNVFVPGHNNDAEIEALYFELSKLDPRMNRDDLRKAQDDLYAQIDVLESAEAVADEWKEEETEQTYAAKWSSLNGVGRNDWLRSAGTRIYCGKDDGTDTLPVPDSESKVVMGRNGKFWILIRLGAI